MDKRARSRGLRRARSVGEPACLVTKLRTEERSRWRIPRLWWSDLMWSDMCSKRVRALRARPAIPSTFTAKHFNPRVVQFAIADVMPQYSGAVARLLRRLPKLIKDLRTLLP